MRNIIEHMGVQALVEYLPADKRLMVRTIGLKEPIYILADNGAEAEYKFQLAVEKQLSKYSKNNVDPFLPIFGTIPSLEIDPGLHERAELAARACGKTVQQIIIDALKKYTE